MSVVLDASFAIDLVAGADGQALQDPSRAFSQDVIHVPVFFWHEVASGLRHMHLRGRIPKEARGVALRRLRTWRVAADTVSPPVEDVIAVCDRFQLTVYDAAYLELALRTASTLATRDNGLAKAAAKAGVGLVKP